jgi:ADP-ribose pyrophosphatase YjhB (NUDIX family)
MARACVKIVSDLEVTLKYCSSCGEEVHLIIPEGDNRYRHVCKACDTIHYQNPKVVTGCIAEWQDKVLLCRRAIEPRYGLWTLPAGFMENNESNMQGAARETMEEANARVDNMRLFSVFSIIHINQVYTMYHGDLVEGKSSAGSESLETALFQEHEIPWHDIAFHVVFETLKQYYRDRRQGELGTHYCEINRRPDGSYSVTYC